MSVDPDVARACELHEARAWRDLVEACAQTPGNPLAAEIVWAAGLAVPVLARLNVALFNRVIGLGVSSPATEDDIVAIADVYAQRQQTKWAVCVAPVASPGDLDQRLVAHGLSRSSDFVKVIRTTDSPPDVATDLRIEEVGPEGRDAFVRIALAAFGTPEVFAPWFGASLGRPDWHHYLGFDGDEPVAAGALYVGGAIGWLGYGSTLPSHRGRGGQGAIMARRIRDAGELGCSLVHTETWAELADRQNPSYHNMLRTGFELAYRRANFTPLTPPPS